MYKFNHYTHPSEFCSQHREHLSFMLQFSCRVDSPRIFRGISKLWREPVGPPCSSGPWGLELERSFLKEFLPPGWCSQMLQEPSISVLGAHQNLLESVPLPWILTWLVWEGFGKLPKAWGIWKAPQSLRITELRKNHSEPLALWARAMKKSISYLPGTRVCQELHLWAPGSFHRLPFSSSIALWKVSLGAQNINPTLLPLY